MNASAALSVVAFLTLAGTSLGAGKQRLQNVTPKVALIGTPEFAATIPLMQPKRPRPPVANENRLWLEFETDFDALESLPEVTFKYGLLISVPGVLPKLIEGEVTHVDVSMGREKHSVMYIAPKTIQKLTEGKTFMVNNIKAYWVEVSVAGETLGVVAKPSNAEFEKIQKAKESTDPKVKESYERVSDSLLNKQQTPFAPLFGDYFEATKATR